MLAKRALNILLVGIPVILIQYIYIPCLQLEFARPDDRWMLLTNKLVSESEWSLQYIYSLFTTFNDIQYSPLNTIYYTAIYQINGYDPFYYHLFSVLLHITNGIIVYILAKTLLSAFNIKNVKIIAYITTLIWLIHPLNIEAVVWISASKIPLYTLFSLLSFLFFVRAVTSSNKDCFFWISLFFFILSCLCKEQAVVTPGMFIFFVLLYQLHWKKTISLKDIKISAAFILLSLIISSVFLVVTYYANAYDTIQIKPITDYTSIQKAGLVFYCLCFYFTNLFVPYNLRFNYGYPFPTGEDAPINLYIYAILFVVFAIYVYVKLLKNTDKLFFYFCALFFFIHIFPVLQIIPMTRRAIVADRYMYIPMISVLLAGFSFIMNMTQLKQGLQLKILFIWSILFFYIGYLIYYSHSLVQYWQTLTISS